MHSNRTYSKHWPLDIQISYIFIIFSTLFTSPIRSSRRKKTIMPSTSFIVVMLASVFMMPISAKYSECLELRVSDYPAKCAVKCSGSAEKRQSIDQSIKRLVNEHYLLTPNRPTCTDTMEKCCCGDLPGVCSEEKVLSYCRCNDKEYEEFTVGQSID